MSRRSSQRQERSAGAKFAITAAQTTAVVIALLALLGTGIALIVSGMS